MSNGSRRRKAALDDRVRLRCFHNRCICFILMTFLAGVGVVNILADFYLRGNDLKMLCDLSADDFHFFAAFGALLLLFAEIVLNNVGFDIFRELVKAAGLLSACMLLDGDFFGFALNEVNKIPAEQKFFPAYHLYYHCFRKTIKKRAIIKVYYNDLSFQLDCSNVVHNGGTVTISAIQLAAHMGYRYIYLLGVDHNFDNVIDENGNTVINKDVKNYFCDNYDNDLQDYVVHNLGRTTKGYYAVQEFYPKHGVNIYNATRTTKLEAFPKISFEEAVENITNNSR